MLHRRFLGNMTSKARPFEIQDYIDSIRESLDTIESRLNQLIDATTDREVIKYIIDENMEQCYGYLDELDILIEKKSSRQQIKKVFGKYE